MGGGVGFSAGAYAPPSDSLLMRYREKDGRPVDMVTYGLVREKPLQTALAKPGSSDSASKSVLFRPGSIPQP